ncbi:hypothetical protein GLW08_20305 [Pontibacillus yanchengensis]|uniref:Uncharacterized protein n=2 Tax=Pontibacillus yanchengensis TaxID=462910 RepID=A0ACC7VJP5_9BACI|nr:hypothetical protein [Pontibacillus yanchengensis]MYL35448.1 hypothetical protein [Pontibacillus yanchengensis]MYL55648.1 hypothetical protein [Pontibacillus yanchengensis]
MTNEFQGTLFGEEEQVTTEKKGKQTKSTHGSKKSNATSAKPKNETIKVDSEWTIHYYGESFELAEFIEDIPEEGVTLEQVRVEMAKDFFEMSKDRTHWNYDKENKRVFPIITGAAKGCSQ